MVDRSQEFFSAVGIIKSQMAPLSGNSARPVPKRSKETLRVKALAKELAAALKVTAGLVHELKQLVQRRSLFNDRTKQITETAAMVKKNIGTLTAQLQALGKLVASSCRGSNKDHWRTVSELLQLRLMACTNGYRDALRTRAKVMASEDKRKARFGRSKWTPLVQLDAPMFAQHKQPAPATRPAQPHSTGHRVMPPPPQPAPHSAGAQSHPNSRHHQQGPAYPSPSFPPPSGGNFGRSQPGVNGKLRRRGAMDAPPMGPPPSQEGALPDYMTPGGGVSLQTNFAQHARNRTEDALNLEKRIVEVSETFNKVSTILADQAVVVESIADNIDDAYAEVQSGQTELLKWLKDVSRHRSFIIKIFAVLVVFILLFSWMNRMSS